MPTLSDHSDVSPALALQLEGHAIMANVSTEEYLQEILDKFGFKVFKSERTEKLRSYIRTRNSEGASDSQIAREKGVTQQAITRHRNALGLPKQVRKPWNASVTHCPQGHEYNEENTYRPPSGGRKCRTCQAMRLRERYAKLSAEKEGNDG